MATGQPSMPAIKPLEEMPVQALWLAGLSLAIFLVPTAISLLTEPDDSIAAKQAMLWFGAALLAFLGGLNWGLGLAKGRRLGAKLFTSILPPLIGWLSILPPPTQGLWLLAAAFGLFIFEDILMILRRRGPRWHAPLRLGLTIGIEACLGLAMIV